MSKYYEKIRTHKFEHIINGKILGKKHEISKCIQNEIDNINSSVTMDEIEFVIKKFQK